MYYDTSRIWSIPISLIHFPKQKPESDCPFKGRDEITVVSIKGIFTVDSNGIRKVVGIHDYGAWDATACGKDDEYIGEDVQTRFFHVRISGSSVSSYNLALKPFLRILRS